MEYRKNTWKETLQGYNSSKARGHEIEQRRDWRLKNVIKACSSDVENNGQRWPSDFPFRKKVFIRYLGKIMKNIGECCSMA